ncbi:unnamed protein product [Oikopleura dioica]|uniref:Uncharacterized protein n=1 Tax=Oikopleura dioica TaxID=34765 RepID=E4YHF8_OIKDI|nr:unnamed protein product [Oikopleura dioica]
MSEIYYKNVADLSMTELLQLYNSLDKKHFPAHFPIADKKSVVLNIFNIEPDFFKDDPKFVFEKNQKGEVTYLKDYTDPCIQKFARPHQKVNLQKIFSLLKASSIAEILANQSDVEQSDLDDEQDDDDDNDLNETVRENDPKVKTETNDSKPRPSAQRRSKPKSSTTSSKSKENAAVKSDYRVKAPKYYSSMPIETWLRNMEIFGKCSDIEDSKLITVAISNLLSGDAGANIIESLDDDEMADWNLFKRNLVSSLGQSDEFYKNQFHKYQRGSDSFGLCMANLKAYFKKGLQEDLPSMMTIAKRFWNDSSTAKIRDSKRFSSVNNLNSRSRMRRRERLKSRSRFHHPRICLWQTLNKPKIQLYQSYVRCSRIR